MRLNRYLAQCGVCSRRQADELIAAGRVTVDGERPESGRKVTGEEQILVDGKAVHLQEEKIVVAFYKPVGVTCTDRDPHAERTLHDVFSWPVRLTYAGRLDKDSEGLLLMTNDGALIDAMMRARNGHEKEYIVRTRSRIPDAALHQMSKGVMLKDLGVRTRPCEIERLGDRTFRIVLTQGLNRQIRRMCAAVGAQVRTLKRIRVLNVELGPMRPGEKREVTGEEKELLYEEAGLSL